MNAQLILTLAALGMLSMPLFADVSPPTHTASPDAPVEMVSPGRYTASIMPGINGDMGGKLEQSFSKIPGLEKVKASSSDSSIHFTVKDGAKVPITSIQNAVTKTDSDAVMSAPVLEHSLAPSPGL
jgi:hypothetical protein